MATVTAPLRRRRRSTQWVRRMRRDGRVVRLVPLAWTCSLVAAGLVLLLLISLRPADVAWAFYGPLIVLAGLFLPTRPFVLVCSVYLVCLLVAGFALRGWSPAPFGAMVALVITMVLMMIRARSRDRLGVHGNDTEDMLVDLRDKLRSLADIQGLPRQWHAERCIRSAFGDKFSGDFAVTSTSPDGRWLEIVLVDLSGKGVMAGTSSLLFSGALGGLLGQVESERVLPAANTYVLRQQWLEGFATAVHVCVDLHTGHFSIGNAGHPAPVQFIAGSGLWTEHASRGGPALGLIEGAQFPRSTGIMHKGDALVLYTDGVIETPDHDLATGIDRMIGTAEALVGRGFAGGARRLCSVAKAGETDDRAVIMLWRS
ncbi:MAG: PP2C family protein-serine/threonine phosphatase [Dermatophilaceae bacterium]